MADAASAAASAALSLTASFSVASYTLTPLDGFELLEIPGADLLGYEGQPMLPLLRRTIALPAGAVVRAVERAGEHAVALGRRQIPAAAASTQYNPTAGYSGTFTVTGTYPSPRFAYEVRPLPDRTELVLTVVPAAFNVGARDLTLYDTTALRVDYDAPSAAVLAPVHLDKLVYRPGDQLVVSTTLTNLGASADTWTPRFAVLDELGSAVTSTTGQPVSVAAGSTQPLSATWAPGLGAGSYHLVVSAERGASVDASSSAALTVVAGATCLWSATTTAP